MSEFKYPDEFVRLPEYGKLFTIEEWEKCRFISYDGSGYYTKGDKMNRAYGVWEVSKPSWATGIMWFNR